jgi:hypothetical protein
MPAEIAQAQASEPLIVEARHPHWTGRLHLDPSTSRVVLALNGSTGSFTLQGETLEVRWDRFAAERFRLIGGCFVHLDLCPTAANDATKPLRAAIVTSYYKEPRALIERSLRSVREQTVHADHIVVADGHPQDWIDTAGVRHIRLDKAHGDYGNTPRGIGSLLAIAEAYDVIGFLDADNWLEPNHIGLGIATASGTCDYAIARWHLRRPDGSILPIEGEPIDSHVDTNCFLFFPGSFHAIMTFALMPQQLSPIGDRVFYAFLRGQNLASAIMPAKTVNYHCLWESVYRAAGETPPPDAKPNIDQAPIQQWLSTLSSRERVLLTRRTGLTFT